MRKVPTQRQAASASDRLRAASEEYCQDLTRREARNFYWGFLALPKRQRVAMYALYSFSRQVDDAIDLNRLALAGVAATASKGRPVTFGGDIQTKRHALSQQRSRIRDCYSGQAADPVMRVLAGVVGEYGIPEEELSALVRGVEMDLERQTYTTWPELEQYCLHVASAVGRMCTRIFGFTDEAALKHANDLGIALQITNILRDVREDAELGRVYLPQAELKRFGIREADLSEGDPGDGWRELVKFEATRAREYFQSGLRVIEYIPRRAGVCVRTMAGMYTSILDQIEADPLLPLRQRARLRKRTKLKVMLGSWLRAV